MMRRLFSRSRAEVIRPLVPNSTQAVAGFVFMVGTDSLTQSCTLHRTMDHRTGGSCIRTTARPTLGHTL